MLADPLRLLADRLRALLAKGHFEERGAGNQVPGDGRSVGGMRPGMGPGRDALLLGVPLPGDRLPGDRLPGDQLFDGLPFGDRLPGVRLPGDWLTGDWLFDGPRFGALLLGELLVLGVPLLVAPEAGADVPEVEVPDPPVEVPDPPVGLPVPGLAGAEPGGELGAGPVGADVGSEVGPLVEAGGCGDVSGCG